MRNRWKWMVVMVVVLLALGGLDALAQDDAGAQFAGDPEFPAPDFSTGLDWLNVTAPLSLADLRGKVVLLDFWTYGCINCIHMIPVLEQLEAKYGSALAVIGVHSAKFANEGQTDNIRQIVERYGLAHPVINDHEFVVWGAYQRYGVTGWPSFVVIDPRGNLFAAQSGEIPFEAFDRVIGGMIGYFDSLDEINRDPIPTALEGASAPATALAFPGKVTVDPAGGRLFIADSSHHRIVIADLTGGEVLDVIGTGTPGYADGGFDDALFNAPQGMALRGDTLYIADTDNHLIRTADLVERTVSTLAGTGERGFNFRVFGQGTDAALASPWDVTFGDPDTLYIAMAGMHQIWEMTLSTGSVGPLVGSGREGKVDGGFNTAELAQPSGLYFHEGLLYFADSESSTIRLANTLTREVTTLAGTPENDLFDFGDVDGTYGDSRLQHALAVVGGADGLLYVADTYNSKLKVIDPATNTITTLAGQGGNGGYRDGALDEALFDEPGGLAFADGLLYVADTNNQAVRVVDLSAGTVSTLAFPNPEALQIGGQVTVVGGNSGLGLSVTLPAQTVAPGAGEIVLSISLPEGYKLNTLAPFIAEWTAEGDGLSVAEADRVQSLIAPESPIRVPVTVGEVGSAATLTGDLTIYYCEAVQESLCFIDQVRVTVPVTADSAGGSEIVIERAITPPG